jgi:replicative DNA helicase
MQDSLEKTIISNLVTNNDFSRKVIPFIKEDYFSDRVERKVFEIVKNFIEKYHKPPTKDAVIIGLEEESSLTESDYKEAKSITRECFDKREAPDFTWLMGVTEKFCKDRAIYNAVLESIQIIDGKTDESKNHLPKLLQDALSVSFDSHIGHDYIEDGDERYEFYHRTEEKTPFDITFLNQITNGGVGPKTLNVIMAGTGVGKSLFMCHHTACCLSQSKNVLYITCEMAEEKIAERIDANIMDITMGDLHDLPKALYQKKLKKAISGISGKLIIKEYPTATANANHFRALLEELHLKKGFKPDIIFIDYLNICSAARYNKNGANVNSYMYIKAIAEELRGLAVEQGVPIFTATQTNRTGFVSTDVGLEDTSESFGLPATADFMIAMIATDELDSLNQVLVKQLKNRYNDPAKNRKFIVGINRGKMKLYDVGSSEQENLICSGQEEEHASIEGKYNSQKFTNWKI